jgi:hypothetical protein
MNVRHRKLTEAYETFVQILSCIKCAILTYELCFTVLFPTPAYPISCISRYMWPDHHNTLDLCRLLIAQSDFVLAPFIFPCSSLVCYATSLEINSLFLPLFCVQFSYNMKSLELFACQMLNIIHVPLLRADDKTEKLEAWSSVEYYLPFLLRITINR